ncbi:MAG: GDP-L-fucose synthase [Candidatus Sericytochromatia bacterium]|nr:MAG: GDP-L-fucose synthase [Candidatus Sericytochromatia bacterium]
MKKNSKIFIAGHTGLVGSAIKDELLKNGYNNLILKNHSELDLINFKSVKDFFEKEKPEYVFLCAAKVGGILANNKYRAEFIYNNLQIQNNVIHCSYLYNVKKLLFLGSSCIYPKNCPQPIKEEYLLTGELEYTNEPYAIAKIAGLKMCESYNIQYGTDFISVMPTNLYGKNDNYDLEKSHVIPALIRKIFLAKLFSEDNFDYIKKDLKIQNEEKCVEFLNKNGIYKNSVKLWGSGRPRREFLHSEDLARACLFIMNNISFKNIISQEELNEKKEIKNTHINIGTGIDITIKELAHLIKDIIGYNGTVLFDYTKPDGTFQKLLDVSKINKLGWKHNISLEEGLKRVFNDYLRHFA